MDFRKLTQEQKEVFNKQLIEHANKFGGKNGFLTLIEDIKKEELHPLVNKTLKFKHSQGSMSWNKSIYKDTMDLLISTISREDKVENIFDGLKSREQKRTLNMLKALKPILIKTRLKNLKDGEGFDISIIEVDQDENYQISFMFKAVFVYNIELVKKILNYKIEE
jgi:hypothetical protein